MSLVNDMLRDLDRRKRMPSNSAPMSYAADEGKSSFLQSNWKLITIIVLGVIIGAMGGSMFFSPSRQVSNQISLQPPVQSITTEASVSTNQLPVNAGNADARTSGSNVDVKSINIFEDSSSDEGFKLRIISARDFSYNITSQDAFGINILLEGINSIAHNEIAVSGVNFVKFDAGVSVGIKLQQETDFLVYEETKSENSFGLTLIVEAVVQQVIPARQSVSSTETDNISAASVGSVSGDTSVVQNSSNDVQAEPKSGVVRTARVLTDEDQDLKVSQNATVLIQRGQFMAAYADLLTHLEQNIEAHHSRETLATLLFAQQEYEQANVIVDQGLLVAPNYSAFKKIKARLYMLNNEAGTAAEFLKRFPPELRSDPEYFELLASALQQSNQYNAAIEAYQNLIRYDQEQARWWVGMGVSHEAIGNIADAISSYKKAIQNPELESSLRQYSQTRIRYLQN